MKLSHLLNVHYPKHFSRGAKNKEAIHNQAGCKHLELWQDKNHPNIFSTYSIWENEDYLNQYRDSETFGKVWPATKALFAEKPIASSHLQRYKLD